MKGLRAYTVLYLAFLYAPILLLPVFAFNNGTIITFPLQGFTTKWFAAMAADDNLRRALTNSLIIVSMSLLVVLTAIGVPLSVLTVILGHVLICVPYSIAILTTAFNALDTSLEEAAYDLGETRLSAFRLVILPLVMPGIISSMLMTFTISLDEFIIAFFLAGNQPTLPTYIFSLLRFPKNIPMLMALGTCLVVLSVLLITIAEYFRRRGLARTGAKDTGGFL